MEILKKLCSKFDADLFDIQTLEIAVFQSSTNERMSHFSQWCNRVINNSTFGVKINK